MKKIFLLAVFITLNLSLSAKKVIDSLLIELEQHLSPDLERVQLLNQLGFEYWIVDPHKSEEYGIEALNLATQLKSTAGTAYANRVIGVAHWVRGNYEMALGYLYHSLEQYKKVKDPLGEANVTMNIGLIYADQINYEKALSQYFEARKIFEKLNEESRIATTDTKIGTVYANLEDFEKAETYFNEALAIHQNNNFHYGIAEVNNRLGVLFMQKKELDRGLDYLKLSVEAGKKIDDQHGIAGNYEKIGRLYWQQKKFDKAEDYLNKGIVIAKMLGIKSTLKGLYFDLKDLKMSQGKYQEALEYFELYSMMKDSLFNEEKAVQFAKLQTKLETEKQKQEIKLLQQESKFDRLLRWGLIASFLVLAAIAWLTINLQKLKIKKNKALLEQKQVTHEQERSLQHIEIENARLKALELNQELAFKKKELTSYAINFVHKNELMEEFKQSIQNIKKTSNTKTAEKLNGLLRLVDRNFNQDKDWEDFKLFFEQVNPDFFNNLKNAFPQLSSNDLKLCSLLRLNMNTKEMASILGISPDSVKTARYRLRKKLNLPHEENLIDFLLKN